MRSPEINTNSRTDDRHGLINKIFGLFTKPHRQDETSATPKLEFSPYRSTLHCLKDINNPTSKFPNEPPNNYSCYVYCSKGVHTKKVNIFVEQANYYPFALEDLQGILDKTLPQLGNAQGYIQNVHLTGYNLAINPKIGAPIKYDIGDIVFGYDRTKSREDNIAKAEESIYRAAAYGIGKRIYMWREKLGWPSIDLQSISIDSTKRIDPLDDSLGKKIFDRLKSDSAENIIKEYGLVSNNLDKTQVIKEVIVKIFAEIKKCGQDKNNEFERKGILFFKGEELGSAYCEIFQTLYDNKVDTAYSKPRLLPRSITAPQKYSGVPEKPIDYAGFLKDAERQQAINEAFYTPHKQQQSSNSDQDLIDSIIAKGHNKMEPHECDRIQNYFNNMSDDEAKSWYENYYLNLNDADRREAFYLIGHFDPTVLAMDQYYLETMYKTHGFVPFRSCDIAAIKKIARRQQEQDQHRGFLAP